jgi:hypothetical protein
MAANGDVTTEVAERRELEAKLYLQGLTLKQIGETVSRSESVVMDDLARLGIERRRPGAAAGSVSAMRPRKHPPPTPRPCEYCGEVFTPGHATHVGKYCSRLCGNRAKAEAQGHKRGEWRTCLNCGETFWRYQSQMALAQVRGDFCLRKCWGDYRWRRSDGASLRNFIEARTELGLFGADARREWLGRFGGRKAPGPGGQPRGRPIVATSPEKVARVHELAARGRGRRTIAQDVDLSEYTVRKILSDTST